MDIIQSNNKINTTGFWDSVATDYSSNTMTTHMADYEMDILLQNIKQFNYEGVAGFGVADGSRDPIQIVEYLEKNKLVSENFEIFMNDISANMLTVAKTNIKNKQLDKYINHDSHNQLCNISHINFVTRVRNPLFCIGVYNAEYIVESLELYNQNKNTVGKEFILTPIYLTECDILEEQRSISFDISKHNDYSVQILEMAKSTNFYAYRVKTNNNFISHFFSATCLKHVLTNIFKNMNIIQFRGTKDANHDNRRYIINIIKNDKQTNFIVTMLNNVLGNIYTEDHIKSLAKLRDLI